MQQLPTILPPPALPDGTVPERTPERQANLIRFQSELEFVQCLANPQYLHELHGQKYFEDDAFIEYLKYLEYWRKPEYVRFITYPTSLVYLTLLLTPAFRSRLGDLAFVGDLMRIGARHHETWRAEKEQDAAVKTEGDSESKDKEEKQEEKPAVAPATAAAA